MEAYSERAKAQRQAEEARSAARQQAAADMEKTGPALGTPALDSAVQSVRKSAICKNMLRRLGRGLCAHARQDETQHSTGWRISVSLGTEQGGPCESPSDLDEPQGAGSKGCSDGGGGGAWQRWSARGCAEICYQHEQDRDEAVCDHA